MKADVNRLKNKKLFLLDMDGTVYIDENIIPGTLEFLEKIVGKGGKYVFLTNNSSKGLESYIEKMHRLGIKAENDNFLTSVDALIVYLIKKYGESQAKSKKYYVVGTSSFKNQLIDSGFMILSDEDARKDGADMLILGFDRELTYEKLETASILLNDKNMEYIATNPDWVCPTSFGSVPDCGSMAQMLSHVNGRMPKFIGKPEPDMANLAVEKNGYTKEETVLIGDRLYTDIACGNRADIDTIFVLSGEGTKKDLLTAPEKPTWVFDSVKDIITLI